MSDTTTRLTLLHAFSLNMSAPVSLTLFCKVVDNFGDIGICYRLARQLVAEHQIAVNLWVNDLTSFQRICPEVITTLHEQTVKGIRVLHWADQNGANEANETNEAFTPDDVTDIVIEFFGCDLPPSYIVAMKIRRPVWINLEGLSAEQWVEGCHMLPSPQHTLTKYFFYPGFTDKTGGLLLESDLLQRRRQFQQFPEASGNFLRNLGMTESELTSVKVSLFCYPGAPVQALFNAWQNSAVAVTCLIPQNVASAAMLAQTQTFLGSSDHATRGALTVRIIPFLPQEDYDLLLWSCDVNFVRGEDSFVRAIWASRPFIWHIYPQDENLHHTKLKAFLRRSGATSSVVKLSLAWNDASGPGADFNFLWQEFLKDRQVIADLTPGWLGHLLTNGDLSSNLLKFTASVYQKIP